MKVKMLFAFSFLICLSSHIYTTAIYANEADLKRAESLFEEALYEDAIIHFYQILNETDDQEKKDKIISRIAYCEIELGNFEKALLILKDQKNRDLYLEAVSQRLLGRFHDALNILSLAPSQSSIEMEKGLNYYLLNDFENAKIHFQRITKRDIYLYNSAQVLLARISLYQNDIKLALNILKDSHFNIDPKEKDYLLGISLFFDGQFKAAIEIFKKFSNDNQSPYYSSALRYLAWSEIKLSEENHDLQLLDEAEVLLSLLKIESSSLDLCQFHIIKGCRKGDVSSFEAARKSLENESRDNKAYFLGLTYLEQGLLLYNQGKKPLAFDSFEKALSSFESTNNPEGIKYRAIIYVYLDKTEKAKALFHSLINDKNLLLSLKEPQHIYYLLSVLTLDSEDLSLSQIKQGIEEYPNGTYSDSLKLMLGIAFLKKNEKEKALSQFQSVIEDHPLSSYTAEAWHWKACCLDNNDKRKEVLRHIYINFPKSQYAAEAYFDYYSYQDYLHGNRNSIKHLKAFPALFPSSPLQISAYYLIGLDHLKDRLDDKGNIIRHQNLTAAIEAFQEAESAYLKLRDEEKLNEDQLHYYSKVRFKSLLEKGKANFLLSTLSNGGKKLIYAKYATDVFEELSKSIADENDSFYTQIRDEADFGLAQAYLEQNEKEQADRKLTGLIERNANRGIDKGYLISRSYYTKGLIALNRNEFEKALNQFIKSEQKGNGLNDDERLDLWINQSHCYKGMNRLNEAMSLLSRVINEDVVSGLRIKAMEHRANIYELQGRPELARKQLHTVAKITNKNKEE